VLHEAGHTHRRLLGTSAGAITATFIAAGYTPEEMLAAVNERLPNGKPRFSSFMDSPANDFTDEEKNNSATMSIFSGLDLPGIPAILETNLDKKLLDALLKLPPYRQLFCFVECGGFFSGVKFLEWIREKLGVKGIDENATLKSFAEQTGSDLSLVASDTSDAEMLVLNHRTAPDCPVAWAVRMSMSIPFVWREVVWQEEWGQYLGRDKTGKIIVDGGVLSNFPIRLIDTEPDDDQFVMDVMGIHVGTGTQQVCNYCLMTLPHRAVKCGRAIRITGLDQGAVCFNQSFDALQIAGLCRLDNLFLRVCHGNCHAKPR
jgi:predicted acylesterase/phospholipase RssA